MDIGHHADSARFLIRDHAGQFTQFFDAVFTAADIRILLSPPAVRLTVLQNGYTHGQIAAFLRSQPQIQDTIYPVIIRH
jgi:hypothetical protein